MKLFLKKGCGAMAEIGEINTIGKDSEILFFFLNSRIRKSEIEAIEKELKGKTGKQCVVLDALFASRIMGT